MPKLSQNSLARDAVVVWLKALTVVQKVLDFNSHGPASD